MIRLIPLGSNGYFPSFGRQTMSFLVVDEKQALLLDAGTGVSRLMEPELAAIAVRYSSLDVVLSHYHLDHVVGLAYLPTVWGHGPVRVHGPASPLVDTEPETAIDRLLGRPLTSGTYRPDVQSIREERYRIGRFELHVWRQQHPGGSIGMRIGDEIAYLTDTVVEPAHLEKVRGVKLLLHEMWLRDEEALDARRAGHSYLSGVVSLAKDADAGALMLVHHHPKRTNEEVRSVAAEAERLAGIPVSYGQEGKVLELSGGE